MTKYIVIVSAIVYSHIISFALNSEKMVICKRPLISVYQSFDLAYRNIYPKILIFANDQADCTNGNNEKFIFCISENTIGDALYNQFIPTEDRHKYCNSDIHVLNKNQSIDIKVLDLDHISSMNGNVLEKRYIKNISNAIGSYIVLSTIDGNIPLFARIKHDNLRTEELGTKCGQSFIQCYRTNHYSQSLLNTIGRFMECLVKSIYNSFYQYDGCVDISSDGVDKISSRSSNDYLLNSFYKFQGWIQYAVKAALILYVIIYGINILLHINSRNHYMSTAEIAKFVLTIILVGYLSIGIGKTGISDDISESTNANALIDHVLPMLIELTNYLTTRILTAMQSNNNKLCNFDISKYESGHQGMLLWDKFECIISYYLGANFIYGNHSMFDGALESGLAKLNTDSVSDDRRLSRNSDSDDMPISINTIDSFNIFTVIWAAFRSGTKTLLFCIGLLIFISSVLFLIFSYTAIYIISIMTIYVLGYLSPIFIPMVLFEQTKEYFNGWLKLMISAVVQPVVFITFIGFFLLFENKELMKNCEILKHDYRINVDQSGNNITKYFSSFEMILPDTDISVCKEQSVMYQLMRYYHGYDWQQEKLSYNQSLDIYILKIIVLNIVMLILFKTFTGLALRVSGGGYMKFF
ncbi:TrbL/VirB6 family protein [Rickettsia endosymbiont of Cardiosporidium cionae]|uniref:type IV secretion system protein n=1 Tax=Rickettsia endosymbiont of Cardiosporidium cionae TaxID=2777155 RepID=UPI001895234D|nr:type IV secretion system protein [Rickettsia endosymbiont of Cardiosporidium cionae]KAF8818712.1 hypothetical protein IHI24_000437 [Rickettsia endosymbiont of Cardiosporidium cionae]